MYLLGALVESNIAELTALDPGVKVTRLEPYGWEITEGERSWTLKGGFLHFSEVKNGCVKCAAKEPYYEEV